MEQNGMEYFNYKGPTAMIHLPEHFRTDQKLKHIFKGIVLMPLKH